MREIKFRGFKDFPGNVLYPPEQGYKYGSLIITENGICWIKKGPLSHLVATDSVGQYTGLKDKNGVEIYEGDIYKVIDFFIHGPVTFVYPSQDGSVLDGTDRLRCNTHPTKNSSEFTTTDARNCEVIGNIYENPELLEG